MSFSFSFERLVIAHVYRIFNMGTCELKDVHFGLVCVFLSISVVLNSVGFYCLQKTNHKALKSSASKQHQILVGLSVSELVYAFFAFGKWISNQLNHSLTYNLAYQVFYAGVFSSYHVYCFLLIVLMTNRLLSVAMPVRHMNISIRQVQCSIIVSWIVGYLLAVPFIVLDAKVWPKFISIGYVVIDALVVTYTIITFSYIGYKISGGKENFENERKPRKPGNNGKSCRNSPCKSKRPMSKGQQKLLTAALMTIFSYLPFVALPDFVVTPLIHLNKISDTAVHFTYSMQNLNFIMDPLVYMFTYPLVRRELKRTFKKIVSPPGEVSVSRSNEWSSKENTVDVLDSKSDEWLSKEEKQEKNPIAFV